MLGLQHPSAESPKQYSANVLPCRINHNGSVNSHARFWHPQRDELDHPVSHLRGRRLQGREVTIPTGYRGVLLHKTDRIVRDNTIKAQAMQELECQRHHLSPAEYTQEQEALRAAAEQGSFDGGEVTILQELGTFHSLLVWGHDELPQPTEDPYTRGIEEWLSFAQALHINPTSKHQG